MASSPNELLTGLLKNVSRSFYLTLRVLPRPIRPQIGLAYLLARTTDTIADTRLIPTEQRLQNLRALRQRILGASTAPLQFGELARQQGSAAERVLLEKVDDSLALLASMSAPDQKLIHEVLDVITSGQELDLQRFAAASADRIVALQSEEELDDYTWRVAGCVGDFWTKICRAHLLADAPLDDSFRLKGIRFGKGLQLVNILRDVPADLRQGRCYLPEKKLSELNLAPADLLKPENEPRLRPLYDRYLDLAQSHLAAGWEYTNLIPFGQARLRLACAWPILIGFQTIDRLRRGNVLDPAQRIKISRRDVRRIMTRSIVCYPLPAVWRRQAVVPTP